MLYKVILRCSTKALGQRMDHNPNATPNKEVITFKLVCDFKYQELKIKCISQINMKIGVQLIYLFI